jgi:hypothetical protein
MSTPPIAFPEPENESNDDPNASPSDSPKRSRLDREIDDILTQSTRTNPLPPISFKQRVSEKRPPSPSPAISQIPMRDIMKALTAFPILTSLAFAILCSMVGDTSPLFARLFALAAAVALVYPIVVSIRGGATETGSKLWRGQVIDINPSPSSPVEQVKRWFRSRPPR